MSRPGNLAPGATPIRSLKTAELVARTLRRRVVDGELREGDFLPNEAELTAYFGVSRPTLREAVRLLEAERIVDVRRGSRTGARVRVPSAEIVARPAGLLLELAGATIADVMVALEGIEPVAAGLLASIDSREACDELEALLAEDIPDAWKSDRLAEATARFHLRLVELSGNATLGMVARMLHQIAERHTAAAIREKKSVSSAHYTKLVRSYGRLIDLVRDGDPAAAQTHWLRHMRIVRELLLEGHEDIKVRDVMD